jgi:cytochrome c oxidase subunit 2
LVAAVALAGCGGGDDDAAGTTQALAAGDPVRGKQVFLDGGCGGCHAFKAAETTATIGPDLDEVAKRYDAAFIRTSIVQPGAYLEFGQDGKIGGKVRYGPAMPVYGAGAGRLTEQQLRDVVAFVESSR